MRTFMACGMGRTEAPNHEARLGFLLWSQSRFLSIQALN
jgi:hypothetical protein